MKNIYVEIDIAAPVERVWEFTQTPQVHERWDLRFTQIRYLPRTTAQDPQQFLYETRIGLGLRIRGAGESVGSHDASDGTRNSALKFWSEDPKSLIRIGSGYWKYLPLDDGRATRFLTSYDYDVRFGPAGEWFDRLLFRPLMGWATAWSFDRLRLWIEAGIDPRSSMRLSLGYAIARVALSCIWLYQGIVPKLIHQHPDELSMLRAVGLSDASALRACIAIGCAETLLGLLMIVAWRTRWPLLLTMSAMPIATVSVAARSPQFLTAPFNPIVLNLVVFALALVAWLARHDLPSARQCKRRPTKEAR